jgi:hypothetical protein
LFDDGENTIMKALTILRILAGALLLLALGACTPSAVPCEELEGVIPICGLQAPEDLVVTPDGRYLIFSQYAEGAALGILDTRDDSVVMLSPRDLVATDMAREWGDDDCPGPLPDAMLAHGLDLSRREDGRWQLLAVNHGGRESVELFELLMNPGSGPQIRWMGCAPAPSGSHFNDVAALPSGGFLVTHMFGSDSLLVGMAKSAMGLDSGIVYRWQANSGYTPLAATEAPFPNGIALTADGKHLFVNIYGEDEIRKYRMSDMAQVGVVPMPGPDNLSWASDGRLLVASHRFSWLSMRDAMPSAGGGPASLHFAIVAIDPKSLETQVVLEREGPPMGAATVAVDAAGYLYLGSFVGDRMAKVSLDQLQW